MKINEQCRCGSSLESKYISHLIDFGSSVLVIRNVPALVCSRCGYKLFDDVVAENLEKMEIDFKKRNDLIEVTNYKEVA
ncbi:MAG: YgiT-type zinc finger protein [Spirochaetes bacterium]|jgi:YgiT-type zinc finger domain-containing protein|nr:YgiT-type zinc finger protein [Spirochaetota bacterium]HRX17332.1 YgiT-type zinc finger protein [Spirochaetota bacterium]